MYTQTHIFLIVYILYIFHKKKIYIKLYNMYVYKDSSWYSFCLKNSLKLYLLITIYIFKLQWLLYKPCVGGKIGSKLSQNMFINVVPMSYRPLSHAVWYGIL